MPHPQAMEYRDLLNSLLPKAAQWNSLGIQLGLSPDELDIIRADSDGVEECLRKMLRKWYDKTLNPTWQVVVIALRVLGEMRLAEELERSERNGKCVFGNSLTRAGYFLAKWRFSVVRGVHVNCFKL